MRTDPTLPLSPLVADHYLFAGLNEAQRAQVLRSYTARNLAKGETLFAQGVEARAFYLVLEGRIKLYRISPDGNEKIVRLAGPGETFAEGVMFMERAVYPVSAQALQGSQVLSVDRERYLAVMRDSPSTTAAVMAQMTGRIQHLLDEIEALSLQNSRYRLLHFLWELLPDDAHGPVTIRLPARKTDIAARLSIKPESLSRLFRDLADGGVLSVQGERVEVNDAGALRRSLALPARE